MNPSEMEKEEETGATDHHSMFHLWEYKNSFAAIFIFTLVLGAPLSINKWWHLRVSSNRSGRGVIKLIQVYHYISLLNVLVILFDLVILMFLGQEVPKTVCILFERLTSCIMMQRCHGDLSIALGRYEGSVIIEREGQIQRILLVLRQVEPVSPSLNHSSIVII